MTGDYLIKDAKLAEWLEKLIGDTRGHAVVKRFKDQQMTVENILFGEVIRLVEVSGFKQRVIFQKEPAPTAEEMEEMFLSREGEERLMLLRMEVDDELERLFNAIQIDNSEKANACREALRRLSGHLLMLEG
jgi:hypothetical protein